MTKLAHQQGIKSLETGISLFRELHRIGRPSTLTELAGASRMHPSKVHRYCVSLIRCGLMQQDARGLYAMGPLAVELSVAQTAITSVCHAAVGILPSLVAEIDETAFVSVWGQSGPTIFKVEEPTRPVSLRPATKGDLPLHSSATGRAFAAYMSPEKLQHLLDAEFDELMDRGKISKLELEKRKIDTERNLSATRRHRVARSVNERYSGLVSFSAPVFDVRGEVILAITAFGVSASIPTGWDSAIPVALRKHANKLTERIGGRAPQ